MIPETYFTKQTFWKNAETITQAVAQKLHFTAKTEIFRGKTYTPDKLGSVIIRGTWKKKPAILKIQGLQLPIDEKTEMDAFDAQNKSPHIRLPYIYAHAKWNRTDQCGYLLMEDITFPPIMSLPTPSQEDREKFSSFFTEYKTHAITNPWRTPTQDETYASRFIRKRLHTWITIAKSRGHFNDALLRPLLTQFDALLEKNGELLTMEFMHGHLSGREVRVDASNNTYVLFGNLFWAYRPKWYDTVFCVWWQLKNPASAFTTSDEALAVIEQWKKLWMQNPVTKKDAHFPILFDILMLERLLGTYIIDLEAQDYAKTNDKQKMYDTLLPLFEIIIKRVQIKNPQS